MKVQIISWVHLLFQHCYAFGFIKQHLPYINKYFIELSLLSEPLKYHCIKLNFYPASLKWHGAYYLINRYILWS